MADQDDDDSSASGFDDESGSEQDLIRPYTHHLGLGRGYSPEWTRTDAFREFFQNWKDGIVASHLVDPHFFKPEIKETTSQIQITIRDYPLPNSGNRRGRLLGYIRFKKNAGTVEMTNFKAKLERKHLDLGETSKRDDTQLAGCHGEGFKLAALVMRRKEHSVKFATNSFYWNFDFRGTRPSLCCRLTPAKPEAVERSKQAHASRVAGPRYERGLISNIWEDMTVKIGKGKGATGRKVEMIDFRAWMKVSFDLDGPQEVNVVRTAEGDLILDPRYRSTVYLHGLRVGGYGPDGRYYYYGYNFHRGYMNRDRERLTNQSEEAQMLARIWEEAIDLRGDAITDSYIGLFSQGEELPDVILASRYVSARTAKAIFERLRALHAGAFFFSDRDPLEISATKDEDIIARDLKSTPFKIDRTLWKVLRVHKLVMTPLEQRNHVFETSELVDPTFDTFSANITHALQGSLALNPELKKISICYVQGGETDIDLLYAEEENLLRIHQKWLDTEQVHSATNCELSKASASNAFFCDHAVQHLLEMALDEVRGPFNILADKAIIFRRTAAECHSQMPRLVQISAPDTGNTLIVSWVGNESGFFTENYGATVLYRVTLHTTATCDSKLREVLNGQAADENCDCPVQIVSQAMPRATFDNLDHKQTYFPMVARVTMPGFFGIPPNPISPKVPTTTRVTEDEDNTKKQMQDATAGNNSGVDVEMSNSDTPGPRQEELTANTNGSTQIPLGRAVDQSNVSDAPLLKSVLSRDEKTWQKWHEDHMPEAFSRFVPRNDDVPLQAGASFTTFECAHLNFMFETDKFACVEMRDEQAEHIILVHSIFCSDDEPESVRYILSYTKFGGVNSTYPFMSKGSASRGLDGDELVLYFKDFGKMGKPEDADRIGLDDILSVRDLDIGRHDGVEFTTPTRPGTSADAFYCRYAICTQGVESGATLTPVASHLLQRVYRWKEPSFTGTEAPMAIDLAPGVLGPAEGMVQAGVAVQAAFNFDREKHVSWKIWHSTSDVYDGGIPEIFEDIQTGRLLPPTSPRGWNPKFVIRAAEHTCFRLAKRNTGMPSMEEFSRPLGHIDEILDALKPEFLVLLLPPAVLHPDVSEALRSTIFSLLERRLSVHLKLTAMEEYGLPQSRSIITMVASPFCASFPWHADLPEPEVIEESSLEDAIGDLAFFNLRSTENEEIGLVCSPPTPPEMEVGTHITRNIFNHETGKSVAASKIGLSVRADSVLDLSMGLQAWLHPTREDRLTVREIARVQGLPDELVFYGNLATQYEAVGKAIPPIIAKTAAEAMLRLIRTKRCSHAKVEGLRVGGRPFKRARVEDEDEGETDIKKE